MLRLYSSSVVHQLQQPPSCLTEEIALQWAAQAALSQVQGLPQ